MTRPLVLAVDVGGTTIKAELVDAGNPDGPPLASRSGRTPQGSRTRDAVAELGDELIAEAGDGPVVGAGVVVPGLVDADRGVATYSANIGWRDLELVRSLGDRWGVHVRIGNDVACGGAAEHRLGAGRGVADMVFVPIGTGIAAAIVSGGRLLAGPQGGAAELGHVVVRPGVGCSCGSDGCLEAVASAGAIARRYAALTGNPVDEALDVARLLAHDATAQAVWGDAVDALATGLTTLSLLLAPALVVVGGGLAESGELLLGPLRVALEERARIVEPPGLAVAAHGPRAGIVGAALLACDGWATPS